MKIPLKFQDKDKTEETFRMIIEDENFMPDTLLNRLYNLEDVVSIRYDGEYVHWGHKIIKISDVTKLVIQEKFANLNPVGETLGDAHRDCMKKFRAMHEMLGLPKKLPSKKLKIDGYICVTKADKTFLLDYFRDSRPYGSSQKKLRKGTISDEYAENLLWMAEGLYNIYSHMKVDRSTLQRISDKIAEETKYPYWKEKVICSKILEQVKISIEKIINNPQKSDKEKKSSIERLESKIIQALEEK